MTVGILLDLAKGIGCKACAVVCKEQAKLHLYFRDTPTCNRC